MRTLSPTSKARPARLTLLPNMSDCRLKGLAVGVRDRSSVDLWGVVPTAEDDEATEDGRPATERRPDCKGRSAGGGEDCRLDISLARLPRCCAGSFALMASAKARDIYSTSEDTGGYWFALEDARDLPGAGIALGRPGVGIPDCRGFPGVTDMIEEMREGARRMYYAT